MPGHELTHRLHLPSLAVELPDGWSVFDEATFAPPSGTAIRVRLSQAGHGLDSSVLAENAETAARAGVVGIENVTASTIQVLGRGVGHQRRYAFDRDGIASIGRIVCFVDGETALTLTASWAAADVGVDAEVDAAVAGIRLLNRPVATFSNGADHKSPRSAVKRPPVDVSSWSELRAAWLHSDSTDVQVADAARWSAAELAVCATILGAASFPTVGPEVLASLPPAVLRPTLETVMNSFVARDLVRAGDDGWASLGDGVFGIIDVAVFPDLTISIEQLRAGGSDRWWFGLRPDRAVQVAVLPNGSRECGEIHPGRVIDQILAITGTGRPSSGGTRGVADSDAVTLADLVGGASHVAAVVRVNTAWRVGEVIRGGAFSWASGVDGSLWLAEPVADEASPGWTLKAIDIGGLRAEVVAHLPGAAESSPS